MKKLILLLFIPLVSFGQNSTSNININIKKEKSVNEEINDGIRAKASLTEALALESAAMINPAIEIITPLEIDLSEYQRIALVGITYDKEGKHYAMSNQSTKHEYNDFSKLFMNSSLSIVNPYVQDKKRAKKNNRFLRDIKDPKTLYLYYESTKIGVNHHRILIIRDYNNKIIYRSKAINISKAELVSPFVYF